MASLLYVCVRPELGAADAEHASFRRALGADVVDRLDLLQTPLDIERARGYQGIVVGGSPYNVSDTVKSPEQLRVEADLRTLADAAIAAEVAVFFTCFSIGVVTRMLGGEVVTDTPEPASATVIDVTPEGTADPVFGPSGPRSRSSRRTRRAPRIPRPAPCCSRRTRCAPCRPTGWARICTRRSSTPSPRPATSPTG